MHLKSLFFIFLFPFYPLLSQEVAVLQYGGGGDWYSNPTSLPNLVKFCNNNIGTRIQDKTKTVTPGSVDLFDYPFVHMTGHGNVDFSPNQALNLRNYLISGGFLHIDDNFGLDQFIRLEMKKVFPELEFVELPFTHAIYNQKYKFPSGVPKIHQHDGKPSQGFGLIYQGKLVCFYSYESDLGNGWEDQVVYNDPEEKRQEALKMGANIISYAFTTN